MQENTIISNPFDFLSQTSNPFKTGIVRVRNNVSERNQVKCLTIISFVTQDARVPSHRQLSPQWPSWTHARMHCIGIHAVHILAFRYPSHKHIWTVWQSEPKHKAKPKKMRKEKRNRNQQPGRGRADRARNARGRGGDSGGGQGKHGGRGGGQRESENETIPGTRRDCRACAP